MKKFITSIFGILFCNTGEFLAILVNFLANDTLSINSSNTSILQTRPLLRIASTPNVCFSADNIMETKAFFY